MNNTQYTNAIQQSQIQNLQTQNMIMMAQNSHQRGGRAEQENIWILVVPCVVLVVVMFASIWWSNRQEMRKNG